MDGMQKDTKFNSWTDWFVKNPAKQQIYSRKNYWFEGIKLSHCCPHQRSCKTIKNSIQESSIMVITVWSFSQMNQKEQGRKWKCWHQLKSNIIVFKQKDKMQHNLEGDRRALSSWNRMIYLANLCCMHKSLCIEKRISLHARQYE